MTIQGMVIISKKANREIILKNEIYQNLFRKLTSLRRSSITFSDTDGVFNEISYSLSERIDVKR